MMLLVVEQDFSKPNSNECGAQLLQQGRGLNPGSLAGVEKTAS